MQKLIQDGISMFSDLFFQVNRRVHVAVILNFKLNSSKKKILSA